MAGGLNVVPQSNNNQNVGDGYDPANKQVAANRLANVQQDSNGYFYGDQGVALVDGANATQGFTTDSAYTGSGSATVVAILKGLWNKLSGILNIQQNDLSTSGTITSASGSTSIVALTVGNGISSVAFQISGTFSSGTTLVFEESADNTTWFSMNGRVGGSLQSNLVTSVNGGASIVFKSNGGALAYVRVRCTVFASGDAPSVIIRAGAGVGTVAINSSLPSGQNTIGNIADQAGYITITGAATTTANADNAYTFAQQVNNFLVQNNGASSIYLAYDTAASAGSLLLPPGSTLEKKKKVTALHIYTTTAIAVNGSSPGIYIEGSL